MDKRIKRLFAVIGITACLLAAFLISEKVSYVIAIKESEAEQTTTTTATTRTSYNLNPQQLERKELQNEKKMLPIKEAETTTEPEPETELEDEYEPEDEPEYEPEYEPEPEDDGYIGVFKITWYSASELIRTGAGSADGHTTASGRWAQESHTIAMNTYQRQALGLKWGDQVYIEDMGTFTIEDCGCDWGVIDRFFEEDPSWWEDNPYCKVWIVR